MLAFPIHAPIRPNRLDPEKKKDKKYHTQWGRYCIATGMGHPFHQTFLASNILFWSFYRGNQWMLAEDLDSFLTDESGNSRNRIKITENMIRPMVEQWIGNAIRMEFNAKAVNVSPNAKTRREEMLSKALLMTKVGNLMGGGIKKDIQSQYGTGETEDETKKLFETYYSDQFTKGINSLLRWSKDRNRFDNAIIDVAGYMGITGMGIHKGYFEGGEQEWGVLDPNYFYWDRAAKRSDIKDSSFMGEFYYKGSPDLFEAHQNLTDEERKAIEKFTQQANNTYTPIYNWWQSTTDRIFVCENYWKDCEKQEYGYVKDQYGYECLKRINEKDEETGKLVPGGYTDKDLIIPERENYKAWLGPGNKKRTMYVDILRYCIFTPREICGTSVEDDIVYEWGKVPYQDTNVLNPSSVEYPYKVQTWNYHNGEVLSPIQDAISPQRMLNRVLSATESIVNNSRLSGTVIDNDAIDPQGGEEELRRSMNLGQPIKVNTKNMGVQNVIGTYNGSLGNNLSPFLDYANNVRMVAQNTIGVNEAMQGTGGKASDLVGVKQLQVARGSLIQEKFYARIKDIMLQSYQAVASQGKRIYADFPHRLSQIVGDEDAEALIITKEMAMEDFRAFVHTAQPDEEQKQDAMNVSLSLFQVGLLGDRQVAEVFNRGDLTDVSRLMREFANEKTMAASMQQKDMQQQQMIDEQTQAMDEQKQNALIKLGVDEAAKERQNDLNKIILKEQFKTGHIQEQTQGKIADSIVNREYDKQIEKEKPKPVQKSSK